MVDWILQRAKEGSTWRGLIMLVTAAGVSLSPEISEAIIAAGLALAGLFGVVWKEKAEQ